MFVVNLWRVSRSFSLNLFFVHPIYDNPQFAIQILIYFVGTTLLDCSTFDRNMFDPSPRSFRYQWIKSRCLCFFIIQSRTPYAICRTPIKKLSNTETYAKSYADKRTWHSGNGHKCSYSLSKILSKFLLILNLSNNSLNVWVCSDIFNMGHLFNSRNVKRISN